MERLIHTIPPVFDKDSVILILGSFPSVRSRESEFFYGHPQNRFWRVIAALTESEVPTTIEEKKALLIKNRIALWDVAASCEIVGSSDASMRSVTPNDIRPILEAANIKAIFTNGGKAAELYKRYVLSSTGIATIPLPSTSPANAKMRLCDLVREWNIIKKWMT